MGTQSVLNPTSLINQSICICYCTLAYVSLWSKSSVLSLKTVCILPNSVKKKKIRHLSSEVYIFSVTNTDFKSTLCTVSNLKKVHAVFSMRVVEKRETEQLLHRGVASFNNLWHIKNTFCTRSFRRDFGGMWSFSLCSKTKLPRFNSAVCSIFILYTHQLLKHSSC